MTLLQKLKSNPFALWLCIFSVVMLAPNVFYVFHRVAGDMPIPYLREVQAIGWALLSSAFILYYTLKKNLEMAARYAWFEFGISVCYYWIRLIVTDQGLAWNWYIVPALAFAYMLPWSVKELAKTIKDEDTAPPSAAVELETRGVPDMQAEIKAALFSYFNPPVPKDNIIETIDAAIKAMPEAVPALEADEVEKAFKEGVKKPAPITEVKKDNRY